MSYRHVLLFIVLLATVVSAFWPRVVKNRIALNHRALSRCAPLQCSIDGVSLAPLPGHEAIAEHLKHSISRWLDKEYIPQRIHAKLGDRVGREYIDLRGGGVDELGDLLIAMGTRLEKFDMENAFVNAWDVANKASDLLIERLNVAEMGEIVRRNMGNEANVDSRISNLRSTFERYRLLQRYLEGEASYEDIHLALAIQLGFQPVMGKEVAWAQNQTLAPYRWTGLDRVPLFMDHEDMNLQKRMENDLPDDVNSTDTVLETLVGLDYYGRLKQSKDPAVRRRILVCKWLYVQGFLNAAFPRCERYVPHHLRRDVEEVEEEEQRQRVSEMRVTGD